MILLMSVIRQMIALEYTEQEIIDHFTYFEQHNTVEAADVLLDALLFEVPTSNQLARLCAAVPKWRSALAVVNMMSQAS